MGLSGFEVEVTREVNGGLATEDMTLSMGPQHPSTHGGPGCMPYTDRVDYVAAMPCNQGWAMAGERLGNIEVPKRGEYCRVIATEFSRIHSHLLSVGSMARDIGAYTPFTHAIREREYINDLLEELCGSRLTFHYMRIGGVGWDLPPGWRDKSLAFIKRFEPLVDEFNDLISYN